MQEEPVSPPRPSWPDGRPFVSQELHLLKTDLFMELIETGRLPLRPGVKRLIGEQQPQPSCSRACVCVEWPPRTIAAHFSNKPDPRKAAGHPL